MDVSREVQRFSELLRLRIVASGMTQRAVERKLGWSAGYVSQLLRGNQDLKLKQIYAILKAIGVPSEDLLADFARARAPCAEGRLSLPYVGALRTRFEEPAYRQQPMDLQELLTQLRPMVRELVRETLAASPQEDLGAVAREAALKEEERAGGAPPSLRRPAESSRKDAPPEHPKRGRR